MNVCEKHSRESRSSKKERNFDASILRLVAANSVEKEL